MCSTWPKIQDKKLNILRMKRAFKMKQFFCFRITNSKLKWKKNSLRVTNSIGALSFSDFQVTKMKLINKKNFLNVTVWMSVNTSKSILLYRFLRISYDSIMWSPTDENLSHFCLGATSLFFPETFKFKNFETWLPATYNNGGVVKY